MFKVVQISHAGETCKFITNIFILSTKRNCTLRLVPYERVDVVLFNRKLTFNESCQIFCIYSLKSIIDQIDTGFFEMQTNKIKQHAFTLHLSCEYVDITHPKKKKLVIKESRVVLIARGFFVDRNSLGIAKMKGTKENTFSFCDLETRANYAF